jgi:hypothetical protein
MFQLLALGRHRLVRRRRSGLYCGGGSFGLHFSRLGVEVAHVQSLVLGDHRPRERRPFHRKHPGSWRLGRIRSQRQGCGGSCHRTGEPTRASDCRRRPTRSAAASVLRNAESYPIEGGRPRDDSGGGRTPGSLANSALSPVGLRMAARHGTVLPGRTGSALADRGRHRGGGRNALAHKHAANMRARALSAVMQDIRAAGFISYNAVARELNRRGVPTLRHGKQWYPTTVSRLLVRLAKLRS